MRVVFFGTPAFAVPSLEALAGSRHAVVGVVTQPDKPRGRGHKVTPSPVKHAAAARGIPVLQPDRLRDTGFLDDLRGLAPDLGVVAAYGKILPGDVLTLPGRGLINVHASLLPRWRGAAPIHRAILAGDTATGVTIMRVVQALDAGPMLRAIETPIDPNETSTSVESRLAILGADLLVNVIDDLERGPVGETPQDEAAVVYASRLTRDESAIDLSKPAADVHNMIRGLQPWPLASALLDGRRVRFLESTVATDEPSSSPPGTVIRIEPDALIISTGHGAIALRRLQLDGRPVVSARDFLNGHDVRPGSRFLPLVHPMTSSRMAAVRVLIALDTGRTTLSAEVERERPDLPDRRDQALFLELAAGVTRWRAELDARIGAYSTRPVDELVPEVRAVLRVAAYQLHHLERIPEHALVHESVEIARALRQERATGFVNGILRNMVRGRQTTRVPVKPADPADTEQALDYLSVALSHPRWLVARWLARVGFDACEQWCRFNNASPEITVRATDGRHDELIQRLREDEVESQPSAYVPGAIRLPAGGLGRLSAETRQLVTVQDEGSQLVACLAGAAPGEHVLDVCASPGGKTLILETAAGPNGLVIASDIRQARVALLRSTLLRAGRPARVVALDATQPLPFGPVFDRVLLDAPCSGLGTLRRDPDIKWHRRPEDLRSLAGGQLRMLAQAAAIVRTGGAVVYATCSSEPEENEAVVDAFLEVAPEFKLGQLATHAALPAAASVIDKRGMLHSSPAYGLDAFFAAVLVRRERA